jgi:hypothetical protein
MSEDFAADNYYARHDGTEDQDYAATEGTDLPALVREGDPASAAIRAVLALHADAGESQGYTQSALGGYGYIDHCCGECGTFGEYGEPWPCATVRVIRTALGTAL